MTDEAILNVGRFLRLAQLHRLSDAFSSEDYVRITYAHQVREKDAQNFEKIIQYFLATYTVLTPAEFFRKFRSREKAGGRYLLMTFDDGLMSSYHAARKILSRFKIKAVFFIPTGILGLKTAEDMKNFSWKYLNYERLPKEALSEEDYLTMGRTEILELYRDGHAVFPHTHTHCRLKDINSEPAALEEIRKPKEILQNLLQCEIDSFAFPVGTERVVNSYSFPFIQREYKYCFTALAGRNTQETDRYFLHRDNIHGGHDLEYVRNTLQGVYDLYYHYKMFRLKKAMLHGINRHGHAVKKPAYEH